MLKNLVPDPKPTETPAPKPEEILAAKDKELQDLREQLVRQDAETKAREKIESDISRRFAARQQGPSAPPASQTYQAQQELNITDEEILARPREAVEKIAAHLAQKQLAEYNQNVGVLLGNLYQQSFESQIDSVKKHPFYEYLEDSLLDHFEANPQEQLQYGRVKAKFDELVGKHYFDLQEKVAAKEKLKQEKETTPTKVDSTPAASRRVVDPPVRTPSPSPPRVEDKPDEEYILSDMEKEVMQSVNSAWGVNMNAKEWAMIREGKLLPPNRVRG